MLVAGYLWLAFSPPVRPPADVRRADCERLWSGVRYSSEAIRLGHDAFVDRCTAP
jgi:hypothetical protein